MINAENRHTITPQGWTHEQDNTKVQRGADGKDRVLVREFGFNDYRRIRGYDFSPGYKYWKETAPFWAQVRERWIVALSAAGGLRLSYPADDEKFIGAMFDAADVFRADRDTTVAKQAIEKLFAASVLAGDAGIAGAVAR